MIEVRAEIYDFSRDLNGNPTANFTLWLHGKLLFVSRRRVQTGYASSYAAGALWKANKLIKGKAVNLEVVRYEGSRSEGALSVMFQTKRIAITLEQAKRLSHRDIIYHLSMKNADGTMVRARVNGQLKLWKTRPTEFRLPMEYGVYECFYLDLDDTNASEWSLEGDQ